MEEEEEEEEDEVEEEGVEEEEGAEGEQGKGDEGDENGGQGNTGKTDACSPTNHRHHPDNDEDDQGGGENSRQGTGFTSGDKDKLSTSTKGASSASNDWGRSKGERSKRQRKKQTGTSQKHLTVAIIRAENKGPKDSEMSMDAHVGMVNRTKKANQANKCWAIAATQSVLSAGVLTQRLLDAGGRNSIVGQAIAELASQTPTKGDVACWTKHDMRGIITKVDNHHRTATIQHMVQPPKGKAPSRTIPMSELTLVAKNLPKAIAKAEGIVERIADGKQHDAMDALEAIIMRGRSCTHQAFQLGVGTKSMRKVTCCEHEGASERPLVSTYDVFPGVQVNAFSDRSRANTATLLERIQDNTAR